MDTVPAKQVEPTSKYGKNSHIDNLDVGVVEKSFVATVDTRC